jgi:hypothetical protein
VNAHDSLSIVEPLLMTERNSMKSPKVIPPVRSLEGNNNNNVVDSQKQQIKALGKVMTTSWKRFK